MQSSAGFSKYTWCGLVSGFLLIFVLLLSSLVTDYHWSLREPWAPSSIAKTTIRRTLTTDRYSNITRMPSSLSDDPEKANHRYPNSWQAALSQSFVKPGWSTESMVNSSYDTASNLTVLFWTSFNDLDPAKHGTGQAPFLQFRCPVHNCLLTRDRAEQTTADALLWATPLGPNTRLPDQRTRPHRQKYIFLTHESQKVLGLPSDPLWARAMFNVTMTFSLDSDIPHPYGVVERIDKLTNTASGKSTNFAVGKFRLVAWAVSHCSTYSRRERYVQELQRFVNVDVYGACGPSSCGDLGREGCLQMINETYKFYLAFENALCKDYVTEKLYGMLRRGGIVPIVLGGANYTKLLPPRSYIDIRDFTSPRQLALYLQYLDVNDDLYNEYFEWQLYYRVVQDEHWMGPSMYCRVCEYLHRTRHRTTRHPDMISWWNNDAQQCMTTNSYYDDHVPVDKLQTWT